jgi:hypothetical protein
MAGWQWSPAADRASVSPTDDLLVRATVRAVSGMDEIMDPAGMRRDALGMVQLIDMMVETNRTNAHVDRRTS